MGSSLLLFGIFLVMIYVATGRAAYVVVGLGLFAAGAYFAYRAFDHVQSRIAIWIDPFADPAGRGYQLVQSLFALAAGGMIGTGPGQGLPTRIPFVETDFIFSAIGEELGLLGAAAVVLCFLVLVRPRNRHRRSGEDRHGGVHGGGARRVDRAAGVRDRRRRDPADPADRRHASVRELRRLVAAVHVHRLGAAAARGRRGHGA